MASGQVLINSGTAPTNPAGGKVLIYSDTADKMIKSIDENGAIRILAQSLIKIVNILNGTTTYAPTANAKALYVECIGAGGAGGGAATSSSTCSLGAGGGGGAYSALWTTTIKTFTVAVGAGGTGVSGGTGNVGGDTTFDSPSICTAKGGAGGTCMAAGSTLITVQGALGGAVGSGVGDLKQGGDPGNGGLRLSASAGCGGNGGNGPLAGGGGLGVNTTVTVGGAGQVYGGGGGGSFTATTAQVGGAGANGLIRVWEFA